MLQARAIVEQFLLKQAIAEEEAMLKATEEPALRGSRVAKELSWSEWAATEWPTMVRDVAPESKPPPEPVRPVPARVLTPPRPRGRPAPTVSRVLLALTTPDNQQNRLDKRGLGTPGHNQRRVCSARTRLRDQHLATLTPTATGAETARLRRASCFDAQGRTTPPQLSAFPSRPYWHTAAVTCPGWALNNVRFSARSGLRAGGDDGSGASSAGDTTPEAVMPLAVAAKPLYRLNEGCPEPTKKAATRGGHRAPPTTRVNTPERAESEEDVSPMALIPPEPSSPTDASIWTL